MSRGERMRSRRGVLRAKVALCDEHGMTTVSMAVCIFLSVALIFTGAQLYRVQSAGEIGRAHV